MREWALLILVTNSTGQPLAFIFPGVHYHLSLLCRFWYLSHIVITLAAAVGLGGGGC